MYTPPKAKRQNIYQDVLLRQVSIFDRTTVGLRGLLIYKVTIEFFEA